jgi:hypothetical protein
VVLVWTGGMPVACGELWLEQHLAQEFGQREKREVRSLLGQPGPAGGGRAGHYWAMHWKMKEGEGCVSLREKLSFGPNDLEISKSLFFNLQILYHLQTLLNST